MIHIPLRLYLNQSCFVIFQTLFQINFTESHNKPSHQPLLIVVFLQVEMIERTKNYIRIIIPVVHIGSNLSISQKFLYLTC